MSDDKKPAASPDAKPKADARMDAGGRAASGTKADPYRDVGGRAASGTKADPYRDVGGRAASGTKAEQPPRPDKTQHRPGQRVAINSEQFTEDNTSINSTREED